MLSDPVHNLHLDRIPVPKNRAAGSPRMALDAGEASEGTSLGPFEGNSRLPTTETMFPDGADRNRVGARGDPKQRKYILHVAWEATKHCDFV